jgi:hypothetical protein
MASVFDDDEAVGSKRLERVKVGWQASERNNHAGFRSGDGSGADSGSGVKVRGCGVDVRETRPSTDKDRAV